MKQLTKDEENNKKDNNKNNREDNNKKEHNNKCTLSMTEFDKYRQTKLTSTKKSETILFQYFSK